jgi:hypothetical protein
MLMVLPIMIMVLLITVMVLYGSGYGVTLLFAMGLVLVRRALALWGTMLAATGGT